MADVTIGSFVQHYQKPRSKEKVNAESKTFAHKRVPKDFSNSSCYLYTSLQTCFLGFLAYSTEYSGEVLDTSATHNKQLGQEKNTYG